MNRPRILLLSGGSLVGQNVIACLDGRRDALHVGATNSVADEPTVFDFDAVYLMPPSRTDPQGHARRFAEVLAHFAPDLVVPCRDDDVSFLARQRELKPSLADRFVCGAAAVASAMLDKLESARFSAANGLPFVPTLDAHGNLAAARRFAAAHGWPLVAKPRLGFASQGVQLILDDRQLAQACASPHLVLQRYLGDGAKVRRAAREIEESGLPLFFSVEDTKLSLQACIAPDGRIGAVFASGNVMRMGRSERVHVIEDADLGRAAREWAGVFARAGWRGPLNMQCQRGADGALAIYEYNGRFTGATAARRWLGFDEVGCVLHDWLGLALPAAAPATHEVVRYLVGRPRRAADARELGERGCWQRSGASAGRGPTDAPS